MIVKPWFSRGSFVAARHVAPMLALAMLAVFAVGVGPKAKVSPGPGRRAALSPSDAVEQMLARMLRAPEVQSRVTFTRSDPFGGPDERTTGRLWFLPGLGLRFQSGERGGEEVVVDREKGSFQVYRPSEKVLYRADWERAPARMRQLIAEPERILDTDFRAVPERRLVGGALRDGFRLHRGIPADSLSGVSVWIAADPVTGLPRWISAAGDEDSVEVELRSVSILPKANPSHLGLPREVRTEPLDPRELLPGGESR
jgi:hypothetical protein